MSVAAINPTRHSSASMRNRSSFRLVSVRERREVERGVTRSRRNDRCALSIAAISMAIDGSGLSVMSSPMGSHTPMVTASDGWGNRRCPTRTDLVRRAHAVLGQARNLEVMSADLARRCRAVHGRILRAAGCRVAAKPAAIYTEG